MQSKLVKRIGALQIMLLTLGLTPWNSWGFVESFDALPGDPTWSAPNHNWEFLSDTTGNGTVNNAITGSVVSGGPFGKYGKFAGTNNDGSAVTHFNTDQFTGTFSFVAMFNDDPTVSTLGQNRFWLGPNRGSYGNDQRAQFYINKSNTPGKLWLQLNRGAGGGYVSDNSLNLNQWYRFNIEYDLTAPNSPWTLSVRDLFGNTVFDEQINYKNDSSVNQVYNYATWEKRYGPNGTAKSLDWNIDQINMDDSFHPAEFGKQWVRANPFTMMGGVIGTSPTFNLNDYLDLGFTTVFANNNVNVAQAAANAGVPWMLNYTPGSRPYTPYSGGHHTAINNAINQGNSIGIMLPDEPILASEVDALAESAAWMRQNHPDKLVTVTVFQNNLTFLNNLITKVRPDVLMFDSYPFRSNGTTELNEWFGTLMPVRAAAKAADIPYWGWLQSYDGPGADVRVPSESDLRFNAFTMLTAGFTGLNYFLYDNDPGGGNIGLFFDSNGNKTPLYNTVATITPEIKRLGVSLRHLTSEDVRFVSGGVGSTPTGLTNWSAGAGGDSHMTAAAVVTGSPTTPKDGLIGLFTDDYGQEYFMLTNLWNAANTSAAATSLSFMLTFDGSIDSLLRLNRITGEPERVSLTNHILDITLPGGTGDLFKYDTGFFAGIPGGDADIDGDVDLSDLATLAANYGMASGARWELGDFDLDGDIDLSDLSTLATYYGQGTAQAMADFAALSSVPEPASAVFVLTAAVILHRRRSQSC